MPPVGLQSFSFTVTQLLQNKPGINLSTTLPFSSNTHCAPNRSSCNTNLMLHSLTNTFPVDVLQMGSPFKKNQKTTNNNTTQKKNKMQNNSLKCHRELIYLLLLLSLTTNNLAGLEISSLASGK